MTRLETTTKRAMMTAAAPIVREHAEPPAPGWRRVLLHVVGLGLLIATGAIHLDLYLTGYRTIPLPGNASLLLWLILGYLLVTAVLVVTFGRLGVHQRVEGQLCLDRLADVLGLAHLNDPFRDRRTADRRPRISPPGSSRSGKGDGGSGDSGPSYEVSPRSTPDTASRFEKNPAAVLAEAYGAGQYQDRCHRLFCHRSARCTGGQT
jgi:hypothetical protein